MTSPVESGTYQSYGVLQKENGQFIPIQGGANGNSFYVKINVNGGSASGQVTTASIRIELEQGSGIACTAGEQPRTPEGNSSFIARWDGETWKQLDTSKLKSSGYLALDKSGGLYVGSLMSEPSGYIDYWDGTNWKTITAQLAGEAPAIYDMTVDANGHLYIGGSFESVNGIPARYIASWDGSSWHALGEGFNQQVNALAFDPGGDLYAVGLFTEAGGLSVQHMARWDGKTWHVLGP